jgi:hypothetical protein
MSEKLDLLTPGLEWNLFALPVDSLLFFKLYFEFLINGWFLRASTHSTTWYFQHQA